MRCPICQEAGVRHRVYSRGSSTTLLAGPDPYYDEEDNWVVPPDPNTTTTHYECSEGHRFTVARREGAEDEVRVME